MIGIFSTSSPYKNRGKFWSGSTFGDSFWITCWKKVGLYKV